MIDQVVDKALLSRLKSGDEDAFREIFTKFRDPLIRFINNILGSWHDAEDICQETFAALWQQRETIDTSKNISTFIFLIAKRKTWKFIRDHSNREGRQADSTAEEESDISPEDVIRLKELRLLVDYAVDKLPARTREIYRMYYYDGLSNEQISERLGINSVNISSQLYQARKKIKEIISIMIALLTAQYFA